MERPLWLLLACVLAYMGWHLRGCIEPDTVTVTQTDTTYIDRVVPETTVVTKPVERIIYERTTDTVEAKVPVPTNFRVRGLIGAHPIDIDGHEVTLTRWDPDGLRWTQDIYRVPRREWELWPSLGAARSPYGPYAGVRANVRYKRVSGYVGYAYGPDRSALTFGVYLRPFTIRF